MSNFNLEQFNRVMRDQAVTECREWIVRAADQLERARLEVERACAEFDMAVADGKFGDATQRLQSAVNTVAWTEPNMNYSAALGAATRLSAAAVRCE